MNALVIDARTIGYEHPAQILVPATKRERDKFSKFIKALDVDVVNLDELRALCWRGIPHEFRPVAWKLMLGYLPAGRDKRVAVLSQRRKEYYDNVGRHYPLVKRDAKGVRCYSTIPYDAITSPYGNLLKNPSESNYLSSSELSMLTDETRGTIHQIRIDLMRMSPDAALFRNAMILDMMERLLYIWAVRHPASGYVQGMHDILMPLILVFLVEHTEVDTLKTNAVVDQVEPSRLFEVESDVYWCYSYLLDGLHDRFTFAQPGIQKSVQLVHDLAYRLDKPLVDHIEQHGVEFLQFAFRWMNCLLLREIPARLVPRMWDTYLAEPQGFSVYHSYVCVALLLSFSSVLRTLDFQPLMAMLQNLPTVHWTVEDLELVLSQAWVYRSQFGAAPSHLRGQSNDTSPTSSNSGPRTPARH